MSIPIADDALEIFLEALTVDLRHRPGIDRYLAASMALELLDNGAAALRLLGEARLSEAGLLVLEAGLKESDPDELAMLFKARLSYSMSKWEADKWLKVWLYLYPNPAMVEELLSRTEIQLGAEDLAWALMLRKDWKGLVAHLAKGGIAGSRVRKALVQGDNLQDYQEALSYLTGRSPFEVVVAREYALRMHKDEEFLSEEKELYRKHGERHLLEATEFLRHVLSPSEETMEAMLNLARKDRWGRAAALLMARKLAAEKGEDRILVKVYKELAGLVSSDQLKGVFALRGAILAYEHGRGHDAEDLFLIALEKGQEPFLAKRYLFYYYLASKATDQILSMDAGEDPYLASVISFLGELKSSEERKCSSEICAKLRAIFQHLQKDPEEGLKLIPEFPYDSLVLEYLEGLLLVASERWEDARTRLKSMVAQLTAKEASRTMALYVSRLFYELGRKREAAEFLKEYFTRGGAAPREDGSGFPWLELMLEMPEPEPEWFESMREELTKLRGKYESDREGGLLAKILTIETHFVEDPTEKIELLLKAAKIHEEITGDVHAAVQSYLKVLELDKSNRKALEALSRIYETMEAWEDLLEVTKHMISLTEDSSQLANLYFKYGSILEAQFGKEEEALNYYKKAWKVSRHSLPALHGMRDIYKRRGDWEKVLKTLELEAGVWEDPKEKAGIYVQIGNVWKEHFHDYGKAERFYEAARKLHPTSRAVIRALFELYSEQEQWDKGVELVSSLDKGALREGLPEERAKLHLMRGRAFLHQKEYQEAAEAFLSAIQLYPQLLEPMEELTALSLTTEEIPGLAAIVDECEEIYISKGPKEGVALVKLARANMSLAQGRIKEALSRYREAHELSPCLPAVYKYYAQLLLHMNMMEELRKIWEAFPEKCPPSEDNIETYVLMADYLNSPLDMPKEALRVLRSTLAKLPNNTRLLLALARILLSQNLPREVIAIGERLIGSPSLSTRDRFWVLYYMGLAHKELGKYEEALAFLGDASDVDPENLYVRLHLAHVYALQGRYEEAFAVLSDVENHEAALSQAVLEVWAGRPVDAEAWIRSIVNEFPPPKEEILENALRLLVDVREMTGATSRDEMEYILERLVKVAPEDPSVLERYVQVLPSGSARARRVREALAMFREEDSSVVPKLPEPGSLAREELRLAIGTHDPTGLEAQLWMTLKDVLEELYAPPLPEIAHPASETEQIVWGEMERLFDFKGELWVGTPVTGRVMVIPGDPPKFLVDPRLFDLSLPAIRFVLARAVESAKSHYGLLFSLSIKETRALLNILNELRRPANVWGETLTKIVDSLDRKQLKALKRILTSADEDLANLDFMSHIVKVERALDKMGLLAAGDFAASMKALHFISSNIDGSKMTALECYYLAPRARELLGIYLSSEWDEYLEKMNPSPQGPSAPSPDDDDVPTAVVDK